jgi:hypothetical protein
VYKRQLISLGTLVCSGGTLVLSGGLGVKPADAGATCQAKASQDMASKTNIIQIPITLVVLVAIRLVFTDNLHCFPDVLQLSISTGSLGLSTKSLNTWAVDKRSLCSVEYSLATLLQFFSFLVNAVHYPTGFGTSLLYRVFHDFGCLIAQFLTFLLYLDACLFPRSRRQQQHRPYANQASKQQADKKSHTLFTSFSGSWI